ncbi:hypothetical protein DPM19_04260 [Actinomadura craniellae]|uniref:Tetratricopeptide repeat protein n=1 Tax=Actinomadura craniellae TaxID=2231787 RepID=A0A365HBN1_9ACTN|nr:hypothetical protein DPM19_04260 [Actinomadura craniellae]
MRAVPTGPTVEVDAGRGPAESFAGLRAALAGLRAAGATFTDVPQRGGPEWRELFPAEPCDAPPLAEIALAPSERRLHRESEQVFRVLAAGAAALCHGAVELGRPVVIRGVGETDLASLRGFMRAVEHARLLDGARLVLADPATVRAPLSPVADLRAERARCLTRMGLDVSAAGLAVVTRAAPAVPSIPATGEGRHFAVATAGDADVVDRLAAALVYTRLAFFSANWEGMAAVAATGLSLIDGLPDSRVAELVAAAEAPVGQADAIEFEPAIVRTTADVRAFFHKVLGVQATFRGLQEEALGHFRRMRDDGEDAAGLSPESRAQSHLYSALTLAKRLRRVDEATAELAEGFAAVRERAGEPDSVRRERGWLHNLQALAYFSRRKLRSAFEHEKQALGCIEGLDDASSIHLRVNLFSNLSVLQEKAGKPEQAIRTWNKFTEAAGSSDTAFLKHHAYRAAGLKLLIGDREEAIDDLARSLACAAEFDDDFHETEIRLETGTLLLAEKRREQAAEHFTRARAAAQRLGDPYRSSLALAGLGVARGGPADEGAVARLAGLSLSRPRAAADLAGSAGAPDALLPWPHTKLNRPFDLINFDG